MGRIILTPGGPRHPLEARAPAVRDEATVIIFLAVHSPSTPKVKAFPYLLYTGSAYAALLGPHGSNLRRIDAQGPPMYRPGARA